MEQKYFTHTFAEGDEIAIVELFEKTYRNYGGYTRKTPDYWRWCCLQRPDVEKESIFLVSDQNSKKIVGYAVVGKSGTIWELSYDPEFDGKQIVVLLLDQAIAYLEKTGASSVNFTAPQKDPIIKQACEWRDFTASLPPKMFLSVLDFKNLLFLFSNNKARELKDFHESLLIEIQDAPAWINRFILIQISHDKVTIENENRKATIQIQTDYLTLSSLLFGKISPLRAFFHLKLKIKPVSKILITLRLLSKLQLRTEWAFLMSEYG